MPDTPLIDLFIEDLSEKAVARLRYVLRWLCAHPLAPVGASWQINSLIEQEGAMVYGKGMPAALNLLEADPPGPGRYGLKPFKWREQLVYGMVESSPNGVFYSNNFFGFDVFATLFYLLSRMEEYHPQGAWASQHGDFAEEKSVLIRAGVHHEPVADRLAQAFFEALGFEVKQRPSKWMISHDIDHLNLWRTPFGLLRYLLWVGKRHQRIKPWPGIVLDYFQVVSGTKRDPAWNFDTLFGMHETSERYVFFPAGGYTRFDKFYPLEKASSVLEMALSNGYQVGIHPSYACWKDGAQMETERTAFENWSGQSARLSRQHFLHFHFPETADLLEASGVETDFTLGYRNHIGYRCGTGFPYALYHFSKEEAYRWREYPLTIMDVGLLRESGLNQKKWTQIKTDFNQKNQFNTGISLNFHNTFFYEFEKYGWEL